MSERFKKLFTSFNVLFWLLPFAIFMLGAQVIDPHDSFNSLMVDYAAILGTLSQIIMILFTAKVFNIDLPKFIKLENPHFLFVLKIFFITHLLLSLPNLFYCVTNYQIIVKFFTEDIFSINLLDIFQKPVYEWRFLGFTSLLTAPIVEEIIFRLYNYNPMRNHSLRNGGGVVKPIIVSSIYFALYHIFIYGFNMAYLVPIGFIGIALAYTYEKTKILWSSILLHFLWNVSVLVYRSLVNPLNVIFDMIVSVIGLIVCVIILITYLTKRRKQSDTIPTDSVPDTQE